MNSSERNVHFVLERSGFDTLQKDIKSATQFSQVLVGVIQERIHLETEYAKGLAKLHAQLAKAAETLSGTVAGAWLRAANTLETESQVHQEISEALQNLVLPSSREFVAGVERQMKPICSAVEMASSRLFSCRRREWKARKKAYAVYRAACQALSSVTRNPQSFSSAVTIERQGSVPYPAHQPLVFGDLRRSQRSCTMPLPATTDGSTMSAADATRVLERETGMLLADQTSLSEKTTKSVWQSILSSFRASLESENARIEWHAALFQSTCDLFMLERSRLFHLCGAISSYRTAVFNSLDRLQFADSGLGESLAQADEAADFAAFYSILQGKMAERKHLSMSMREVTKPLAVDLSGVAALAGASRLTSLRTPVITRAINRNEPQPPERKLASIGGSRQTLVALPGELESLFKLPKELQEYLLQISLQKRFLVFPSNENHISPEFLQESMMKVERAEFSSHIIAAISSLLAREATKEERTKEGLTNLVEVYGNTPAYTDDSTFSEVRRRLFISRCRLSYLSACRARLACVTSEPELAGSPLCSLRRRLSGSGYSASKEDSSVLSSTGVSLTELSAVQRFASSTLSRWIPVFVPSVETKELLKKTVEWPPLTEDLCELECLPPAELDIISKMPGSSALGSSIALTSNQSSGSHGLDTLADLTDSDFESDFEMDLPSLQGNNAGVSNGFNPPLRPLPPHRSLRLGQLQKSRSMTTHQPDLHKKEDFEVSEPAGASPRASPALCTKSRRTRLLEKIRCRGSASQSCRASASPEMTSKRAVSPVLNTLGKPDGFIQVDAEVKRREDENAAMSTASECKSQQAATKGGLFTRLGARFKRQGANSKIVRLEIIAPWRQENVGVSLNGIPAPAPSQFAAPVASNDLPGCVGVAQKSSPSLASLHCLGWAKVICDYDTSAVGELALLEGEIVSVIQKISADWWLGESGGKHGRFPVANVEEF